MMSQGELEALSMATERAAINLEVSIMKDIVRRIKANLDIDDSLTASADYQIRVLRQMGYSDEYIKTQIQTFLKASEEEIDRIYHQVSENQYKAYEDAYDALGRKQTPFGRHPIISQTVRAAVEQSKNTFKNLTNTMGFTRNVGGKRVFLPVASYYQRVLDEATLGVTTGAFDYATMLARVVKEMTKSGLRTVEYASGRTYRVESAARMALMTGFRQIISKVNEQTAEELETDTYEVSYHIGARPDHQVWQGRVYTYKELISICGLGTAGGLCGVNCYHWYEPYIEGVSVRNYTDGELDRMVAKENEKTEFDGKEYTTYEALQRQRKLELTMRKYRQDILLLKEGGNEGIELLGAQARYRQTMDEYVRFSKAMKLPQQRERIYMDGLGRVTVQTRKSAAKSIALCDSTDKWAKEARDELLKSEKSISDRTREVMEIYGPTGEYIMTKRGDVNSVRLSILDYKKLKNAVVTHNHPSGGSFSYKDLRFLKNMPISELRVSTKDCSYFIRKPRVWPSEIKTSEQLEKTINDIRNELRPKYLRLYNEGKINKVERHILFSEEVNKTFAERYGLDYGRESHK